MSIKKEKLGEFVGNQKVYSYTLTNKHQVSVRIMTYGGIITHLYVPDKDGNLANIVMGFDELNGYINNAYMKNCPYFGAIIGRYANRIKNGRFTVGNIAYTVTQNNENNHLHGGNKGFDKVFWESTAREFEQHDSLKLRYISQDGEEGFPGEIIVDVLYQLTNNNELVFFAEAKNTSEKPSPINLTNHSYFNLSGMKSSIHNHKLLINARYYLAAEQGIPTGNYIDVKKDKAFNFRDLKPIHKNIDLLKQKKNGESGFDHNYVIDKQPGKLKLGAQLCDPESQRTMLIFTNKPGLQLYTANGLNGEFVGSHGIPYKPFDAVCLEPQFFPNSPNQPEFESGIIKGGESYQHLTVYKFII